MVKGSVPLSTLTLLLRISPTHMEISSALSLIKPKYLAASLFYTSGPSDFSPLNISGPESLLNGAQAVALIIEPSSDAILPDILGNPTIDRCIYRLTCPVQVG